MQKQVLFQTNPTAQAMAAVRRSLRRLTGYGTDFVPSDLERLVDVADSVTNIGYKGKTSYRNAVIQYSHPKYHHNRTWIKDHVLGCDDAYDKGHTTSRLEFKKGTQGKQAGARLKAICKLGETLKQMAVEGIRLDYTTDEQYRQRGCQVVSASAEFAPNSNDPAPYTATVSYAIPFDEARLQEELEKQNLQKQMEADTAALVAQAQASYSEAAESTRKGEEDLKTAAEAKQEREKITAQTNTSKTLRIVGVVAIVVCVLVAVLLLVKRMKK